MSEKLDEVARKECYVSFSYKGGRVVIEVNGTEDDETHFESIISPTASNDGINNYLNP